ncbi:MAG: hypothetical protein DRR00_21945 [Candidatus Parabeggiatoa sp. nov. 3]|nr:MAG: hypothetical protein DRR00_21945 [Gammaproteobacteria bacterium]RKZ59044.1 MAG: hypothetical protein DRQ99_24460 [Gammaproteobacteria bacterium]
MPFWQKYHSVSIKPHKFKVDFDSNDFYGGIGLSCIAPARCDLYATLVRILQHSISMNQLSILCPSFCAQKRRIGKSILLRENQLCCYQFFASFCAAKTKTNQ